MQNLPYGVYWFRENKKTHDKGSYKTKTRWISPIIEELELAPPRNYSGVLSFILCYQMKDMKVLSWQIIINYEKNRQTVLFLSYSICYFYTSLKIRGGNIILVFLIKKNYSFKSLFLFCCFGFCCCFFLSCHVWHVILLEFLLVKLNKLHKMSII